MLETYIWKRKKVLSTDNFSQETVKIMDMSSNDLVEAYQHCKNMLYNDSKLDPGRYFVLDKISNQILHCGAELAVRWFCALENEDKTLKYSKFTLLSEIRDLLEKYKHLFEEDHTLRLQDLYKGIPSEFNSIPINLILKSCSDTLGKFDKKHITQNFIIKQGVWFTPEEIRDFSTIEKLKTMDERLHLIKERLGLSFSAELRVKPTGLNYAQFRAMIGLKTNKKYSELTTLQLETLRNKILFILEESVIFHINQWTTLMKQIEEVSEYKQIKIN
jgi:hypothetical protein